MALSNLVRGKRSVRMPPGNVSRKKAPEENVGRSERRKADVDIRWTSQRMATSCAETRLPDARLRHQRRPKARLRSGNHASTFRLSRSVRRAGPIVRERPWAGEASCTPAGQVVAREASDGTA